MFMKLSDFKLNNSGVLYQWKESRSLDKTKIDEIFSGVLLNKVKEASKTQTDLSELENSEQISNIAELKKIKISYLVFSQKKTPTFLVKSTQKLDETYGYMFIFERKNYVLVLKKNCTFPKIDFLFKKNPEILKNCFITDDTKYEKLSVKNLDPSEDSLRVKTVEARDLKKCFNGGNSFSVNTVRIRNDNERYSVNSSTSHITYANSLREEKTVVNICSWFDSTIRKIEEYESGNREENFLSNFASILSYEKEVSTLEPIRVVFDFQEFFDENFERRIIFSKEEKYDEGISPSVVFQETVLGFDVKNNKVLFKLEYNKISEQMNCKLNSDCIELSFDNGCPLFLIDDKENIVQFDEYINSWNLFSVYFKNISRVYRDGNLYEDNKLLSKSYTDILLGLFEETKAHLENAKYEKGKIVEFKTTKNTSARDKAENEEAKKKLIKFENESVFYSIENCFKDNFDFFVCDDGGSEWADFLGLSDNEIAFYHAKCKEKNKRKTISASKFQEVIAQATKNLGNYKPDSREFDAQIEEWKGKYITTSIDRIRKNNLPIDEVKTKWKSVMNSLYVKKSVNIVYGGFQKDILKSLLDDLHEYNKKKTKTSYKGSFPELYQFLWLLNGLLSNCKEIGAELRIYCCK